ncbi:MAG: hypothetical protein FJ271_28215 [Planctomycetes bacterium]|nr:hypothetical protein [Planctomycetota bacterium]
MDIAGIANSVALRAPSSTDTLFQQRYLVWSKMGDEAGERINGILARKEAERLVNSFWWGVGHVNCMAKKNLDSALQQNEGILPVLFSKQLSCPKKYDSDTVGMFVWTHYEGKHGITPIPSHALVISKGVAKRYYSLVCHAEESISSMREIPFDDRLCRNFPDGPQPGGSQVTTLVARLPGDHGRGRYRQGFWATLIDPWLVKLTGCRRLTKDEEHAVANWDGHDYPELVRRIRRG